MAVGAWACPLVPSKYAIADVLRVDSSLKPNLYLSLIHI